MAVFAAFLGHSTGYALVALNKQVAALKISLLALILNAGLNFIFIPQFSYLASSIITFITEIFVFILGLRLILKHLGSIDILSGLKALKPKQILKSLK